MQSVMSALGLPMGGKIRPLHVRVPPLRVRVDGLGFSRPYGSSGNLMIRWAVQSMAVWSTYLHATVMGALLVTYTQLGKF